MKSGKLKVRIFWVGLIILLVLSACVPKPGKNNNAPPIIANTSDGNNTKTENNPVNNAANDAEKNTNAATEPQEDIPESNVPESARHIFKEENKPLAKEPIKIEIMTDDGRMLEGYYYPGWYNPGPILVLMHWAVGDMHDWDVIAPWLQNRDLDPMSYGDGSPWWDPSWFPPLPEWASFGVVVFNFGGWGNSKGDFNTWALDAKAAVDYASTLAEANPELISTMGASIGSDGSPDGCYLHQLDDASIGTCLGGFSLSPGNYLMRPEVFDYTYAETVEGLVMNKDANKLVYCLAAENDHDAPNTCLGAIQDEEEFDRYSVFIYPGNAHGMMLVDPAMSPQDPALDLNALDLYLLFLENVYHIDFEE